MSKKVYFGLQLKRAFRHYPSILAITLLIVLCIGISAAALLQFGSSDEGKKVLNTGLVGNAEDTYLDVGISALRNIDSSRFYINLIPMTEEEAVKALEDKKITGYVQIPDNFVRDVMNGTNTPVQYVTCEKPAGFGDALEKEIITMVSDLVTESQKSNYSVRAIARDNGTKKGVGKRLEKLNLSYINYILNRNDTYDLVLKGIKDDLTYGGYYICAIITFFLMIWGISCNKLLAEKNYELSRLLKQRGLGIKHQLLAKLAGFGAITLVTLFIFALIAGILTQSSSYGIEELMSADIISCTFFVIKILPAILMFVAMHIMLYEIFTGSVGSILAQFMIAIGLGYVSGLFYPNTFFPQGVQTVAELLPVGAGFAYIRKSLAGGILFKELCLTTAYTILFYGMATIFKKYKITGDTKI